MTIDKTAVEAKPPWFANKNVVVMTYRINRRPKEQGNLFGGQPASFIDHLTECLLFGVEMTTSGRGHARHWKLGNRKIGASDDYLAGWIGFRAEDSEEQDDYDDEEKVWRTEEVTVDRRATAPFVIVSSTRLLFVAKHKEFGENVPALVIQRLLEKGEKERDHVTTDWAVEPVLDNRGFQQWLEETTVLNSITFTVRLPNPDGEASFKQIDDFMKTNRVGKMVETLTPSDSEVGLTKDFERDPWSRGLMEMVRRSFAQLRAKGTGAAGKIRTYNQSEKVRRNRVLMSRDHTGTLDALVEYGKSITISDLTDE